MLNLHLDAIARRNPELNAIVTFTPELARAQADAADRAAAQGEFLGLLHGLPVAHKDLQRTQGIRTTFGSPLFAGDVPSFDTEIVRRMKAAGCVCVGKTNTPEFGAGSKTFNTVFFGASDGDDRVGGWIGHRRIIAEFGEFLRRGGVTVDAGAGARREYADGEWADGAGLRGRWVTVGGVGGIAGGTGVGEAIHGDAGRVAGRNSGDAI